jgi:uncharacterized protein
VSERNVAAARRLYEARNRRDVEAVIAECHADVEWHPYLSELGGRPIRGHEGIREYMASLEEAWAVFRHEPEDFVDAGDQVVALLNTRARGRESGAELDVPVAHVLLFREGKCVRYVSYMDRDEGLRAAGVDPR